MPSKYAAVTPKTKRMVAPKPMVPRLDNLSGKTIAFCWDYIFRGDEIWSFLKDELRQRYPDIKFVDHDVFGNTHGSDEHQVLAAMPAKLRSLKVDALISGMGC
jgi:hypothetical protein